jgi:hypothetical protein
MPTRPARPDVDQEIRALYHGPFADFVAARQALAKRLKQEGDERAAAVKELRKPSLSAWAVDQLFAHEAQAMAAFVAAGERARAAQRKAEAGGDPRPLREALATIAGETPRLLARGAELLAAAERAPGEAIVERVRTNLEALALDPQTAPVAARGWLDEDLAPPGFEVMAALQVAAAGVRPAKGGPATRTAKPAAGASGLPGRGGAPALAARNAAPPPPRAGASAIGRRAGAPAPAPSRPPATVHRFEDARAAAAERRERAARERAEQERGERIEKLRAEAARAEAAAQAQRHEAQLAAEVAERTAREAAAAAKRARETRQSAVSAEAIAAKAREALRRAERGLP